MRQEYKHLYELLRCMCIEYNQRDNVIVADDDWWERKVMVRFNQNCNGPYLLDSDFCSNSLVMLLGFVMIRLENAEYTKFRNCDVREIYHRYPLLFGKLSTETKTRDSSDEGPFELGSNSRMDISGCHSGEKRKGSARRSKEKAKKGSFDLSNLVEHLASVGEALAASHQNCQEQA
ncbi:Uncharacterized protein Adt_05487 [Abeliophyllum distichum]|uniref:Uncharacterized protein n=1 Tax=Abeliophyllum distichum TaxID=126358 RepID=A0ABD1V489_9LAMI